MIFQIQILCVSANLFGVYVLSYDEETHIRRQISFTSKLFYGRNAKKFEINNGSIE